MQSNAHNKQSGSSIVQVLVGVALLGLVAAAAASTATYFAKNVQHAELNGDVRDLRDYVSRNLDCSAIVGSNGAACNTGGYVSLVDKRSGTCSTIAPVWPHQTPIANQFFVRARCSRNPGTGGYDVNVEYAVGSVGTGGITYKKDPTTGATMDFKNLFSSAVACSSGTYVVPSGWSVRGFLNASPTSGVSLADSTGIMMTEATYKKVCEMIGYPEVRARPVGSDGYTSCGNNELAYWNGTRWVVEQSCIRNILLWEHGNNPLTCGRSLSVCP